MTFSLLGDHKLSYARKILSMTRHIPGDIIEVGVYRGGALWHFANDSLEWGKSVFGYDTFEGLPELGQFDNKKKHFRGDFAISLDAVTYNLMGLGVTLMKGYFPDSSYDHKAISFCHLDVDLYEPTIKSLVYLHSKMSDGGLIVLDDYKWEHCPGVEKAVSEVTGLYQVFDESPHQIVLMKE